LITKKKQKVGVEVGVGLNGALSAIVVGGGHDGNLRFD